MQKSMATLKSDKELMEEIWQKGSLFSSTHRACWQRYYGTLFGVRGEEIKPPEEE